MLGADDSTSVTSVVGADAQDVATASFYDESAGFLVSAAYGRRPRQMGMTKFTVKLTSKPSAAVNIPISVSDTSEATVSGDNATYLSFSTTN